MSKEIMQQALDAFGSLSVECDNFHHCKNDQHTWSGFCNPLKRYQNAIKALEAALAKPEHPLDKKADNARELGLDYEPEQEPVAWIDTSQVCDLLRKAHDILSCMSSPSKYVPEAYFGNIAPPKQEWLGLTFDDVPNDKAGDVNFRAGALWASNLLKERNT